LTRGTREGAQLVRRDCLGNRRLNRTSFFVMGTTNESDQANRVISTGKLHTLLCFHTRPINVVVYHDSQGRTRFEVGFPLRCIQRLSSPYIATLHCGWRRSQGFGCSPIKVVRELGSERRETVRSLSAVGVGVLRGSILSTRGPGWTHLWCTCCHASGIAG